MLVEVDFDVSFCVNFSPSSEEIVVEEQIAKPQQAQQPKQAKEESFLDRLFGGSQQGSKQAAFNPKNYPAIYSTARVISGDTLVISGHYFRLFGIDAPESNQTCADGNGRPYHCGKQA